MTCLGSHEKGGGEPDPIRAITFCGFFMIDFALFWDFFLIAFFATFL
jgi:hypothetical protein